MLVHQRVRSLMLISPKAYDIALDFACLVHPPELKEHVGTHALACLARTDWFHT